MDELREAPVLSARRICKSFTRQRHVFSSAPEICHAVREVSFEIHAGETLGLVGESGCGKTTLARMVARIERPSSGNIYYRGLDIFAAKKAELRPYRQKVQYIFQDPYASLNPRMSAGAIVGEPFRIHERRDGDLDGLLSMVGLSPEQKHRYPHEFSGGQRQRLGIARAIALRPEVVIADEPVSALDVSVQAQILNLLKDLQDRFHLSYLFISHDMGVIRFMSDRVAVMYGGRIVEIGVNEAIFGNPLHPYTRMLMDAVPGFSGPTGKREGEGGGEGAVSLDDGEKSEAGCLFWPRCAEVLPYCRETAPELARVAEGHLVSCHRREKDA
ncbi:MAG: ATP-binding cassette domain-containing protein [Pseudomonadota bacterium]|nr:ATP-binding cassette domain-containing protein [Pseudomonadota bacterium]